MLKNTNKTNTICHTRPDRVSMDSRIKSENDKYLENGRSMVEMLGVLAVIGVLSVGGIAGYTTAMNRHRANDILNDASQKAMMVSAKLQQNKDMTDTDLASALSEFGSQEVQNTLLNTVTRVGENQFKLIFDTTTSSLPTTDICKQMKKLARNNLLVDDTCTRLLYNNDLSTGVSDSGNTNKEDGVCKSGYYGSDCENSCSKTNQVYVSNSCQCPDNYYETTSSCLACPSGDGWTSGTTSTYSGGDVTTTDDVCHCEANKTWNGEKCIASCPSFASTSNTGEYEGGSFTVTSSGQTLTCYCPTGYKYNVTNDNCGDEIEETCSSWTRNECGAGKYCQFSPKSDGCTAPTSGVCKDITACRMGDVSGTDFRHSDYSGDCKPDWWTAQAICKADGGRTLVSLSNVDCSTSGCNTSATSKYTAVRNGGFTSPFWTTDHYSCAAWTVFIIGAFPNAYARSYARSEVLCR